MWPNPQETADLVTFTEEILNGKLHFLWSVRPEVVNELFQFRGQISYELRQRPQFQIPWVHSFFSGTESSKFLRPKVWALFPNEMKQLESLGKFRNAIKQWKPTFCPCRICKIYIHSLLGFFNK